MELKDNNYSAYVIFANPSYQTTQKNVFADLYYDTFLDVGEYLDDECYTHSQDNPQYSFIKYEDKKDGVVLNDGQTSKNPLITEDNEEIRVLKDIRLSTVYNFEVADNHNYYIFDKLWVHE